MIAPELLDLLLEAWGRAAATDQASIRALWYPSSTVEHRAFLRGGAAPSPSHVTPDLTTAEAVDRVDRAMAALRHHREPWFQAVAARYTEEGPDERRAQRMKVTPRVYQLFLYNGRRWLRTVLQ